jgi:hypothetical protein
MNDTPRTVWKVSAADGLAGLAGLAAAPRDAVYYGVVRRIPRDQYGGSVILEWDLSPTELQTLQSPMQFADATAESVREAPIERIVTLDRDTGEWLVLWRIAFRKVDR